MIGESEGIIKIRETIDKVAPTEARILVTGENGVGKGISGQMGARKKQPCFFPIN